MNNRIAMCFCGEPLVLTMMFSGAEYFCMGCGETFGMLGPKRTQEAPDILARQAKLSRDFADIAKACIPRGAHKRDCEKCRHEQHLLHATDEERLASAHAYKKLRGVGHNGGIKPARTG